MNATATPSSAVAGSVVPTVNEIDASCRVPLLVLFLSAAVWLVAASALGMLALMKFHSPDFFSNCAWLAYGRLHPAATNALLYGFALQAGFGVGLWILARMSGQPVSQSWLIAVGAKLWNLGVTVGLVGILAGDSTGFEHLEMPRYAAVLLFLGYAVIGIGVLLTLHHSGERRLEPPQWFLLAALFWFPWIFSTGHLLLTFGRVRGVMQAVVNWWYSANLNFVCLGLLGLGALFYFIPRSAQRPWPGRQLALFTFWTLILFASWSGIPGSAPVPAWMPAVSTVATALTFVTALSVLIIIYRSAVSGPSSPGNPPTGKFFALGAMAFVVSWLMNAAGAIPEIRAVTQFTWFTVAQWQLNVYGFFAVTMIGAIYYIVPRVAGIDWPWKNWVRAHYWMAAFGIALMVLPLAIGGVLQGTRLNQPAIAVTAIAKSSVHFLRLASVGELLLLLGHLLLLANLIRLVARYARAHFGPVYAAATVELKPAEVKP